MNEFFSYRNNQLCAEQVPLADIASRFGTPCYVYSHTALAEGYQQFATAFRLAEHLGRFKRVVDVVLRVHGRVRVARIGRIAKKRADTYGGARPFKKR